MKILILHNEYQQYGGEDTVVKNEVKLLQGAGHSVYVEIISNHQINGIWSKLNAALGLVFSWKSYFAVRKLIKEIRPDVIHVHNFFPLWSPSIFYACKSLKTPVILTLHNYRTLCPTALLMHDGQVTEKSINDGPWWSVFKKVYRGSLLGTFLLALMISVHKYLGTWNKQVSKFIVLTHFAKDKFSTAGFPANKIVVKPNFVDITFDQSQKILDSTFLFVGRLSEEKGINTLKKAVEKNNTFKVTVVGTGPQADELCHSNFNHLGKQSLESVFKQMQEHTVLVMPSIWYEGFPMTLVEAYANGLPVIASRIGALEELVEHQVTGLLFEAGNPESLAQTMQWALDHPQEMYQMGINARKKYEQSYTAQKNLQQLEDIYMDAIQSCHNERSN
ncbi:glycosyltransferase family 1 protein [Acinetobacter cumulans]|jgi:glycosyltransferase involved in cell wall biosynthesis|uniref:Glycosyltransferase family 1 protein n=1 Tax=Acinetobacter cumulans TaxID=2136182 RepID=A0A498CY08_9GAMM|nr:glycosyltransferase family 4 protein [Acinetobacter cumulans]RLL35850.1 glycosyltransferase family 1 protein [Acinetobacter cumulans]